MSEFEDQGFALPGGPRRPQSPLRIAFVRAEIVRPCRIIGFVSRRQQGLRGAAGLQPLSYPLKQPSVFLTPGLPSAGCLQPLF